MTGGGHGKEMITQLLMLSRTGVSQWFLTAEWDMKADQPTLDSISEEV